MPEKNKRKTQIGMVISDKMDKTVTVAIERTVKHPMFKKYIKRTSKIFAHDEKEQCKIGDFVEIKEVRPISKNKNWLVVKVIKQAKKGFEPVAAEEEIKDGSESI
jgi:small subunit ribosomal protein S17